jgi:hypothetical protein
MSLKQPVSKIVYSYSGVVEGGCGGWHPPNNLEGGWHPPNNQVSRGDDKAVAYPPNQVSGYQFTTAR